MASKWGQRQAYDISNFWTPAPVSDQQAVEWMRHIRDVGVTRVICGTQVVSVCQQQLQAAREVGLERDIYIQVEWDLPFTAQVARAYHAAETTSVRVAWVTVESLVRGLSAVGRQRALTRMLSAVRDCFPRQGIYTNYDNWVNRMGNTPRFHSYPLWQADYNPPFNLWSGRGFGGWELPAMRQYEPNVLDWEVNVDRNVY